jgi:hypothetical protein
MTTLQVALGTLSLCLLQGCASRPPDPFTIPRVAAHNSSSQQNECPPSMGKVCFGSLGRSETLTCGCSSASPLGTPYQ